MNQHHNAVNECRGGLTILQEGRHVQVAGIFDQESVLAEFGERPEEVVGSSHEAHYSAHRQRRVKAIKRTMQKSAVVVPPSQAERFGSFFADKSLLPIGKRSGERL